MVSISEEGIILTIFYCILVVQIVQDDELRNMLMDPKLQQILQECNDPRKFQAHMRDPVTAYKIKKLYDAGLVGTAK